MTDTIAEAREELRHIEGHAGSFGMLSLKCLRALIALAERGPVMPEEPDSATLHAMTMVVPTWDDATSLRKYRALRAHLLAPQGEKAECASPQVETSDEQSSLAWLDKRIERGEVFENIHLPYAVAKCLRAIITRGETNPAQQGKEEQPMRNDDLRQAIAAIKQDGNYSRWAYRIVCDVAESTLAKPAPKGWRISWNDPCHRNMAMQLNIFDEKTYDKKRQELEHERVAFKVEPL